LGARDHPVDFLLARPDVDPSRIALYGISQAGYWVPQALAFEHRVAAAIADPGVYNAFEPWAKAVPLSCCSCSTPATSKARSALQRRDVGSDAGTAAELGWRAKPYGLQSPFNVFTAARQYNLADADQITTPMLIADPEAEQF
jgi:hypothetical protein